MKFSKFEDMPYSPHLLATLLGAFIGIMVGWFINKSTPVDNGYDSTDVVIVSEEGSDGSA